MSAAYVALAACVAPSLRARCRTLGDLLTALHEDVPDDVCALVEAELRAARAQRGEAVQALELPTLPAPFDGVALWRGDITALACDAIVNAANSQMLGCFTLGHKCIDNVIHAAAGPRLRMACRELMAAQDGDEPTGRAKITPGFCLPARFVLHTVGPIYDKTRDQSALLASCYTSCLDLAAAHGLRTVAFCCISTGVFGYPAAAATLVAVKAVVQWLRDHRDNGLDMRVVFDTFTEQDTANLWRSSTFMTSALVSGLLRFLWTHFDDEAVSSLFPPDDEYDDMRGVRICAAVHYGALTKMHPGLASFPSPDCFAAVPSFLRANHAWAAQFVQSCPQTNEVSRALALFAALQHVCRTKFPTHEAVRLLELGSSGGLNLSLLHYAYRTPCWSYSPPATSSEPLQLTCDDWTGPPLPAPLRALRALQRRGCDLRPLTRDANLLRCYVWADQPERLALLDRALAAREEERKRGTAPEVDEAEAGSWLAGQLAAFPAFAADGTGDEGRRGVCAWVECSSPEQEHAMARAPQHRQETVSAVSWLMGWRKLAAAVPEPCVTVVMHSLFYQYPPQNVRDDIARTVAEAGAKATDTHPLVWLRFENDRCLGGSENETFLVDVITYPGGERTTLGRAHYHVKWIKWLQ